MKEEKYKNPWFETILISILMSISTLFILGVEDLLLATILTALMPIAFIVLGVRNEFKHGLISMVLTFITAGAIGGIGPSIGVALICMPTGLALINFIKKRENIEDIIIFTSLIFFISLFLVVYLDNGGFINIGIMEKVKDFKEIINSQMEVFMGIFQESDMSKYEISMGEADFKARMDFMLLIAPSLVIIFSLMMTYFNYSISLLILDKIGYKIYRPSFSRFRIPKTSLYGIIGMHILTYILIYFEVPYSLGLMTNIIELVAFLILVQGIAVVEHLLIRFRMKKFLRFIFILFNLLIPGMSVGFLIMGFLDMIFDFRKINRKKAK